MKTRALVMRASGLIVIVTVAVIAATIFPNSLNSAAGTDLTGKFCTNRLEYSPPDIPIHIPKQRLTAF
jgi:hypothetical protein